LLVDFGAVIVHIFSREAREYYNLERLLKPESEIDLTAFFDEMKNKIGDTEG
jgi:ribosomal silencing factor RsfS